MNIEKPTNKKTSFQRLGSTSNWPCTDEYTCYHFLFRIKCSSCYIQYILVSRLDRSFYQSTLMVMTKKLTYRYAFTLLKMKKAEGRSEYIDLAKEANLLWHQIVSQKSKNTPRIDSRT